MSVEYDKYYQTKNLFGNAYPELITFFSELKERGKLLDLGCGQGRDAIPLARLGYEVVGIDNSVVGIEQLNEIAKQEEISLTGLVDDVYSYNSLSEYDFILLDSMFHFGKKERAKETEFLTRILDEAKSNAQVVVCIQNTGKKVEILNSIMLNKPGFSLVVQKDLFYVYDDPDSDHKSEMKYVMLIIKKL